MAPRRHQKRAAASDSIMPLAKSFKSVRGAKTRTFSADNKDRTTRTYASEVRKTIEAADVIIEVLDARDPLGSRSAEIEEAVLQSGKRLVLLLNKIDLVPKENVKEWIRYLRLKLPTIAFQASTQEQANKLASSPAFPSNLFELFGRFKTSNLHAETSKCVGADLVMKLLKNYCRNRDIKTVIRVGIVGYPNVGKSSVINSLNRRRACQTGATPGLTKQAMEIELDGNIRLIDSPGVVLASRGQFDAVEVALKNAMRVEQLEDPVSPVMAILRRCSVATLTEHFGIQAFDDPEQFLPLVARRLGRLKKGGVPDVDAAARHVLNEWNTGKLRYHTADVKPALSEHVFVAPKERKKEQKSEPSSATLQEMLDKCKKSDGGIQMNRVIKKFSKRFKKKQRKTERRMDQMTDLFAGLGENAVKMETEDDWFGCLHEQPMGSGHRLGTSE
ncbi:CP-type G domain-containing protein [Aphelenchoides fujianensis]|nr:CP-type G domain-containing protein [Aphelenchoides fujianensis]